MEAIKEQNKSRKELRNKMKEALEIQKQIDAYQAQEFLYQESTPFEHLKYWSAFICQGLP